MSRVNLFRERSRKSIMMSRPSIFGPQNLQIPIVEEEDDSKQESESYDINASHISSSMSRESSS